VATAAGVAAVAMAVGAWLPEGWLDPVRSAAHPLGAAAAVAGATVASSVVNNLPATLAAFEGARTASPGLWGWLLGANVGSVLVPVGALANLLWLRIVRDEGHAVGLRRYVALVAPIALPALAAATVVHVALTALA
jgi:arsenical pump membrane protein